MKPSDAASAGDGTDDAQTIAAYENKTGMTRHDTASKARHTFASIR
ncbi:hypothetical protein [Paenibacillus flagellatus]|nr:hypothetical protein [Paenibacillus flagellatus]